MFQQADLPTLHKMQAQAERVRWMIHERAIKAYCEAFGSTFRKGESHLDMCVIHNSIISFEQGKPWQEVNYSAMRRARRLCEQSFQPSRLVTQWYRRKCGVTN